MSPPDLTAERVRELLDYDPETGVLTWRVSSRGRRAGAVAGTVKPGEIQVNVEGRLYRAHRLIWLHVHGRWPEQHIDHIDGNPHNNAIGNLRDVSCSVNLQNKRRGQGRTSDLLGVHRHRTGRWGAQIKLGGTHRWLGLFGTPEEAHAAYVKVKRELHPGCTI